jgi:hypothetical protein
MMSEAMPTFLYADEDMGDTGTWRKVHGARQAPPRVKLKQPPAPRALRLAPFVSRRYP